MPRLRLLSFLAIVGSLAVANPIIMPLVDSVDFSPADEVSLVMAPDGSGAPFTAAWSADGTATDATLRIYLVDDQGAPLEDVAVEHVWLQFDAPPGTATGCIQEPYFGSVFHPDNDSDGGIMEWTLPLRGGGWSDGPARIYIHGEPAMGTDYIELPPFPIRVNSPDIDGDLLVGLTDIALFIQGLGGPYHYRSDLCWDGVIDLRDIALFAQGIGAECP